MTTITERREALGLSRGEWAQQAQTTIGVVWSVEHGKTPRDKEAGKRALALLDDLEARNAAVQEQAATPFVPTGKTETRKNGFIVSYEYGDMKPGALFSVVGDYDADARYEFRAVVTNPRNDATWIEAFGGPPGYGAFRSFDPAKVRFGARKQRAVRAYTPKADKPKKKFKSSTS